MRRNIITRSANKSVALNGKHYETADVRAQVSAQENEQACSVEQNFVRDLTAGAAWHRICVFEDLFDDEMTLVLGQKSLPFRTRVVRPWPPFPANDLVLSEEVVKAKRSPQERVQARHENAAKWAMQHE